MNPDVRSPWSAAGWLNLACALLSCLASASAGAACMSYTGETELTGRLVRQAFAAANPQEGRKGEAPATYYFIALPEPGCIDAGTSTDGMEPAEQNLARIQLVFLNSNAYRQLRPFLGKDMACRGSLFHASTGHHHTPVLLFDAQCRPVPRPGKPAASQPPAPG